MEPHRVDFERMSMMRLYRVSDALVAQRAAIEAQLFDRATDPGERPVEPGQRIPIARYRVQLAPLRDYKVVLEPAELES